MLATYIGRTIPPAGSRPSLMQGSAVQIVRTRKGLTTVHLAGDVRRAHGTWVVRDESLSPKEA